MSKTLTWRNVDSPRDSESTRLAIMTNSVVNDVFKNFSNSIGKFNTSMEKKATSDLLSNLLKYNTGTEALSALNDGSVMEGVNNRYITADARKDALNTIGALNKNEEQRFNIDKLLPANLQNSLAQIDNTKASTAQRYHSMKMAELNRADRAKANLGNSELKRINLELAKTKLAGLLQMNAAKANDANFLTALANATTESERDAILNSGNKALTNKAFQAGYLDEDTYKKHLAYKPSFSDTAINAVENLTHYSRANELSNEVKLRHTEAEKLLNMTSNELSAFENTLPDDQAEYFRNTILNTPEIKPNVKKEYSKSILGKLHAGTDTVLDTIKTGATYLAKPVNAVLVDPFNDLENNIHKLLDTKTGKYLKNRDEYTKKAANYNEQKDKLSKLNNAVAKIEDNPFTAFNMYDPKNAVKEKLPIAIQKGVTEADTLIKAFTNSPVSNLEYLVNNDFHKDNSSSSEIVYKNKGIKNPKKVSEQVNKLAKLHNVTPRVAFEAANRVAGSYDGIAKVNAKEVGKLLSEMKDSSTSKVIADSINLRTSNSRKVSRIKEELRKVDTLHKKGNLTATEQSFIEEYTAILNQQLLDINNNIKPK